MIGFSLQCEREIEDNQKPLLKKHLLHSLSVFSEYYSPSAALEAFILSLRGAFFFFFLSTPAHWSLALSPPLQRGPQPDREAPAGQDEQLHRRAGVAGAHLQRHVTQAGQADGAAHGRAAHEDAERFVGKKNKRSIRAAAHPAGE